MTEKTPPPHGELVPTPDRSTKIRTLNDVFRTTFIGGQVVCTPGVQSLGESQLAKVLQAVREFNTFTPDNDPYGEHDFGIVTVDSVKCYWKIDYYDPELMYGSEDPSDSEQTTRVLTIMLPLEY